MIKPFRYALLPLILLAGCGGGSTDSSGGGGSTELPAVDVSAVEPNDPGSPLPDGWERKGAFMEIYVRGFKDSNGDGIGDLKGITQSLDYLQELGIKGIWLMPVTQSQDHDHGYAVEDYRAIERDYGTLADMQELLAAAHDRGIGVIMDYVINHSGATNPLFINSRSSTTNPYRNWYVWSNTHPSGWSIYGNDPWYDFGGDSYFAAFWSQMPDWNLRTPAVVNYHNDTMRYWLNMGVDGFRFDAVGHLFENGSSQWEIQPENHPFMANVRSLLDTYQRRYMVCEAPPQPIQFGTSCGSAFSFGMNYSLVSAASGSSSAVAAIDDYVRSSPATMAPFASNHDSFAGQRVYDQLGGNMEMYRMVASTYLTLPGIPFIYYGEEIGMSGASGLSGDANLRGPLSWTASGGFTTGTPFRPAAGNVGTYNVEAARADSSSIFHHYKALINLRNTHAALSTGSYENSSVQGNTLSFQRIDGSDRVLVVLNYSGSSQTVALSSLPANATLTPLYPASLTAAAADGSGNASVSMGARSVAIYQF